VQLPVERLAQHYTRHALTSMHDWQRVLSARADGRDFGNNASTKN